MLGGIVRGMLVASTLFLAEAAWAQTPIQWVTGDQLICLRPYFDDGYAAWKAGDDKWLKSTGCVVARAGIPIIIISGHEGTFAGRPPASEVWRVRIKPSPDDDGVTAYLEGFFAKVAPTSLAAPAQIGIEMGFKSKASALEAWQKIVAKHPAETKGLTPITDSVVANFWSLKAEGVSVEEGLKRCSALGNPDRPNSYCYGVSAK